MNADPSLLERLKEAPTTPQAQFNLFLARYRPGRTKVFVFVEGRFDRPFYGPFLRVFHGLADPEFVRCDNKKNVLKALDNFSRRYQPDPAVLFFVDRDFDEILGISMPEHTWLFVTAGYSIETYLVSWPVVKSYLTESANADLDEEAWNELEARFAHGHRRFVRVARDVMVWMLAVRRSGVDANLQNVKSSRLFQLDEEQTSLVDSLENAYQYLCVTTGHNQPVSMPSCRDLDQEQKICTDESWHSWLRGKQSLWFVIAFIKRELESLTTKKVCARPVVALCEKNAVTELATRLEMPRDLKTFLQNAAEGLATS